MNPTTPLTVRMLAMIALFEGSRNGGINVWDEQLLSLGTMHFAVGQGTGARLLMRVQQLDPAGTLACLGPQFVAAIKGGPETIKAFCRVNVWKTGNRWQAAFTSLSRLPAFVQADSEAAEPYLASARAIADRYSLTTERGLAWALDRCVQQGGTPRPFVDQTYAKVRTQDEVSVMVALAGAYAATANPKYAGTVRARSLTVARGDSAGTGYPGGVNLVRDFGLRQDSPWRQGAVPKLFLTDGAGQVIEWDGNESGRYGGQPLTRAWVAQLATVYPAGSKATLTTPTGTVSLEVYADGALHLRK